jgi:YegS/Rv2252/BmrU family lipid kinase
MTDHLLVVNGGAGGAHEAAVSDAAEVLRGVGDVEVVTTGAPGDLDEVLTTAGDRRVVICGGDGSIHLAVSRLRALQQLTVPLALIPLGTGNDLARGVGLPFDDPVAAAMRVRDGRPQPVDLLVAGDGTVCVNAVHAGVGADAAARAESLKDRLSAVAYPIGAVLAGVSAAGVRTEVVVDGRTLVDDDVLMVAITNGTCFGGGATMCPDARPDDGKLDVVAVTAVGPVARAAFAWSLNAGEHLGREDVFATIGEEVTVRVRADDVPGAPTGLRYDVDGEVEDEVAERTWRVEPGAWLLVR